MLTTTSQNPLGYCLAMMKSEGVNLIGGKRLCILKSLSFCSNLMTLDCLVLLHSTSKILQVCCFLLNKP